MLKIFLAYRYGIVKIHLAWQYASEYVQRVGWEVRQRQRSDRMVRDDGRHLKAALAFGKAWALMAPLKAEPLGQRGAG